MENNRLFYHPGVHVLSGSVRNLGWGSYPELLRKHSHCDSPYNLIPLAACYDSADKYAEWMDTGWGTTVFYRLEVHILSGLVQTEVEVLIGSCCVNTRVRNKLSIRSENVWFACVKCLKINVYF
ncbi:hypothetical protein CEXT_581561 [Caerostris extrusa]|uniref:HNH nuclease domain-containing protein n=1 Tax=Caerostris extrusa TaxID=172846 RepID=A0AAV4NBG5_CAEEX|nr:hypothetical protein CEXT_581561 [Caerostris extrusa]